MRSLAAATFLLAAAAAVPAQADLTVSDAPTKNVACGGGICTATARRAVLNVGELQVMLAAADVKISTGMETSNLVIARPIAWTSASTLSLISLLGIAVNRPIVVQGTGGLVFVTNACGRGNGEIVFKSAGYAKFWDLSSHLTINAIPYTLVSGISGLAEAIAANPVGDFALAGSHDAKPDGVYHASPVPTEFSGRFEGLGNTISNLRIEDDSKAATVGLFSSVTFGGSVHDLHLAGAKVHARHGARVGTLIGFADGDIRYVTATGSVKSTRNAQSGGLIGENMGLVYRAQARVKLPGGSAGLVASNGELGSVLESFAAPAITQGHQAVALLVGFNSGTIVNSYALGSASANGAFFAGLTNENSGTLRNSYVAGALNNLGAALKGSVAVHNKGEMANVFWNTDTSDLGQACEPGDFDCPQAAGLSDAAFKAALPQGLDPIVWGRSPAINGGLPYLLNNPPQ